MKHLFAISLLLSGLLAATAAEIKPPKGFRALFNGKDLTGWHGLNPHQATRLKGEKREAALKQMRADFAKHWRVEKGELVNDGHGPYANTDEDLGDVEFLIDYKTVPGADSGIYLRGTPQVQIWDNTQEFNPKRPTRRPHLGLAEQPGRRGRRGDGELLGPREASGRHWPHHAPDSRRRNPLAQHLRPGDKQG